MKAKRRAGLTPPPVPTAAAAAAPRPSAATRARPAAAVKIATFDVNGSRPFSATAAVAGTPRPPGRGVPAGIEGTGRGLPGRGHAAGYQPLWKGQRSWNGVAILARGEQAPVEVRRELPGERRRRSPAATWRPRSTMPSSLPTCPTATRSQGPSSITSSPGSTGCCRRALEAEALLVIAGNHADIQVRPICLERCSRKDACCNPKARSLPAVLDGAATDSLAPWYPQEPGPPGTIFHEHWQRNAAGINELLLLNRQLHTDSREQRWRAGRCTNWKGRDRAAHLDDLDLGAVPAAQQVITREPAEAGQEARGQVALL